MMKNMLNPFGKRLCQIILASMAGFTIFYESHAQNILPTSTAKNNTTIYDFATALIDTKNNDPRLAAANQAVIAQTANANITKMAILPQLSATSYVGYYSQKKYQLLPNYVTIFGQRVAFGTVPGTITINGLITEYGLNANQSLLTFGRQQASEAISHHQYRLARSQRKQIIHQITSELAQHYVGCAIAHENKKIRKIYVANLKGIYDEVEKKYNLNTETITNLNLIIINYRNAINDLSLQKRDEAVVCEKLVRLTGKNIDYKKLLPRLSLASIDGYEKNIPNNFDKLQNAIKARHPELAIAENILTISKKTKELSAANLMPTASLSAKVEQILTPPSENQDGTNDSSIVNNNSITLTLNYQQNLLQNILQLSADSHSAKQQRYLTEYQKQATTNQTLGQWQNYQAKKKSLPIMVQSLQEQKLMVDGIKTQYRFGLIPLSAFLQRQQEFLSALLQYHELRQSQLRINLSLLSLLETWS
ncbi:MAG: TolC family protein [Alphaproteobacteria bacterium]